MHQGRKAIGLPAKNLVIHAGKLHKGSKVRPITLFEQLLELLHSSLVAPVLLACQGAALVCAAAACVSGTAT